MGTLSRRRQCKGPSVRFFSAGATRPAITLRTVWEQSRDGGNAHSKPHADLLDRGRPYPENFAPLPNAFKRRYTKLSVWCESTNTSSTRFDASIAVKCCASARGISFVLRPSGETVQSLSRLAVNRDPCRVSTCERKTTEKIRHVLSSRSRMGNE